MLQLGNFRISLSFWITANGRVIVMSSTQFLFILLLLCLPLPLSVLELCKTRNDPFLRLGAITLLLKHGNFHNFVVGIHLVPV
jgi:hypothetical protein